MSLEEQAKTLFTVSSTAPFIHDFHNGRHIIGTYVSMSNAQSLLEHLKLDTASLKELTRQIDEHD